MVENNIYNFSVGISISRFKNEAFYPLLFLYIYFFFSIDRFCTFRKNPALFFQFNEELALSFCIFISCWLHKAKQVNNKWIHSLRPSSRLTLFMQNDILSQIFGNRIWRKRANPRLHSRLIISSAISYSK